MTSDPLLQEKGGLLFVWPVSGPEAFIHSAAKQPAWSPVAENYGPGQLQCCMPLGLCGYYTLM